MARSLERHLSSELEKRFERTNADTARHPHSHQLGGNIPRYIGDECHEILFRGETAVTVSTSNRSRLRRAFTLIELLVIVTIIAVLTALLLPAIAHVKGTARRTECLSRMKQWTLGFISYADDNDDFIPREDFANTGNVQWNNWNAVRHAQSVDVWYNALSNYVGVPSASSYASLAKRPAFYERASLFQCPGASIPTSTPLIALFSVAMNSQLIEPPDHVPTIRFNTITRPPDTVLFQDNLLEGEKRVSQFQAWASLGQPAAMATRFAGVRHGRGGNLAFADGSAQWRVGEEVVETSGPGAGQGKPGSGVIWDIH